MSQAQQIDELKDFFAAAFSDEKTGTPNVIPEEFRRASERICRSYGIRGLADPMYIANVIALELGLGNGQGYFKIPPYAHHEEGLNPTAYRQVVEALEAARVFLPADSDVGRQVDEALAGARVQP